jgi:ribosomal protein L4
MVVLVDLSGIGAPSAKAARAILAGAKAGQREKGEERKVLVVLREPNPAAWKSFRNFPDLQVATAADLCAHDVLTARLVLAEEQALERLAERVGVPPQESRA